MRLKINSIKGRVFLWFFIAASILLIGLGFLIYREIETVVFNSVDNILKVKSTLIYSLLEKDKNDTYIRLERAESVAGDYNITKSGHYYKVVIDNKIAYWSASLVNKEFNLSGKNPVEEIYNSTGPNNEPVRIIRKDTSYAGLPVIIFIAEDISDSLEIIENARNFLILLFPLAIIFFGFISLAISRLSLKPLGDLTDEVSLITHNNLDKRLHSRSSAQELNKLVFSFNEMLDRLKKAFDTERFIISEASHKFKTPISVIKSYCEITLKKDREKLEYKEVLQTIKTVADNITGLIVNILSLAHLDSGELTSGNFTQISLNECLEKAIELSKYLAGKKNITIKSLIDTEIIIPGDEDKMIEVFLNIIENAVKYNRENGTVTIQAEKNDKQARISIEDSGIGIKEQDLNKIFERFYRGDTGENTEGTGLGLNIARTITEIHGGKIDVNSKYGVGSKFNVIFPLKK